MNAFSRAEEKFIFRETDDIMLERDTYGSGTYGFARGTAKPLASVRGSTAAYNTHPNQKTSMEPKLRSKVIITKPSHNPDNKYIRLDTYHDSSDVYRALAKIQEACDYGLNEAEELDRMTSHDPSILTGPWLQRKDRQATKSLRLNDLSPEVLLRCFAFCDLKSLGALCSVSLRFNVLTNNYTLWVPHAKAKRVRLSEPKNARRKLKECILEQRRVKDREVIECEIEYELLSRRMKERSEAIKSEPVNIEATLGAHDPAAILEGKYRKSDGGRILVSTSFVKNIQETLEKLESLRNEVMNRMDANNRKLHTQQDQLVQMELRLEGEKKNSECADASPPETLDSAQLVAFERRMVRLVLNGNTASGTSSSDELPVVLRRGITDFGSVDLLCLDSSMSEATLRPIKNRFGALKRFFPLNDSYYTVRAIVESRGSSKQVPKKCVALFEKTASLIQRIQAMSDGEVLSVVL